MHDNHFFIFNGISSADFGVYIFDGTGTFAAAERDRETMEVPGRNGMLIIDNRRYKNVDHVYKKALITDDMKINFRGLCETLSNVKGYARLEDSVHPDEFYSAILKSTLETKISPDLTISKGDIIFSRKPQRFLKSGEEWLTITGTTAQKIKNPTSQPAEPILRVYGAGKVYVDDVEITIASNSLSYIDIDCEAQECYLKTDTMLYNANQYVTIAGFEYPKLKEESTVRPGSGISKIEVLPRWWRL